MSEELNQNNTNNTIQTVVTENNDDETNNNQTEKLPLDVSENTPSNLNAVDADRVLASIVRIDALLPIQGADRIVVAEIVGWKCVVNKDDFKVGDLAVYYCEDSIPNLEDPNLQFLKDKGIKRIKIMKLRGVVSQGLLGPLKWLEGKVPDISQVKEGDDVTEILQVKKYVRAEEMEQYNGYNKQGKMLSEFTEHFPKEVPKTDENRLQGNLKYLYDIVGRDIVITRKEDGCSCTFVFNAGKFSVCGRNFTWLEGNLNSGHYFHIEKKYKVGENMTALARNIGIQGEVIGPKVNGNKMNLTELDFEVFNIFDIDTKQYLDYDQVSQICATLKLKQVPLLYSGKTEDLPLIVDNVKTTFGALSVDMEANIKRILAGFIEMSNNLDYAKNIPAEGLVTKTNDNGRRISFKVISNRFSLKHSDC